MTREVDKERWAKLVDWYNYPELFYNDIYNESPFSYQENILKALPDFKIKRMMALAAGGTGKTKLMGCIALWHGLIYSYFKGKYDVVIISGSEDQAKILYNYAVNGISNNKILQSLVDGEILVSLIKNKNGSFIMPVSTSLKSIQGKHMPLVIIDEAVLAGDFIIRDAFRIIGPFDNNRLILSGTPMQYASLFVEMWLDKNKYPDYNPDTHKGWKRYTWSAKDCPIITDEQREEAKKLLPEDMYKIFWEGQPYELMLTLIPHSQIIKASKDVQLIKFNPDLGIVTAGIDWGFQDATVICISQLIDGVYRILYVEAWRRELYSDLHKRILQLCREYHVSKVYADNSHIGENQRLADLGLNVTPIKYQSLREMLQSRLKAMFHTYRILIPDEYHEMLYQIKRYTWDTHTNDDYVDALMMSIWKEYEDSGDVWWKVISPIKKY